MSDRYELHDQGADAIAVRYSVMRAGKVIYLFEPGHHITAMSLPDLLNAAHDRAAELTRLREVNKGLVEALDGLMAAYVALDGAVCGPGIRYELAEAALAKAGAAK